MRSCLTFAFWQQKYRKTAKQYFLSQKDFTIYTLRSGPPSICFALPPYSWSHICVGMPKTALCFAHPDCGTLTCIFPLGYFIFDLHWTQMCVCMMAYRILLCDTQRNIHLNKHMMNVDRALCATYNSNMNERNVWLWCDRAMQRYFSGSHKLTGDRLAIAFAYIAWCLSVFYLHHLALFWDFPTRHKHRTCMYL